MTDQAALDDLERSLATVLRMLTDRVTTSDLAARCGYDLPPASWALLEHLDAHGALRVSDIAACHGVDVSSITPRLKRLENAGLVSRGRLPTDARAFLIRITPAGSHALESIHCARREILRDALDATGLDRVPAAVDVLHSIAVHLSAQAPDPLPASQHAG
ncbi:MarR family winged helix-turn-helix transcriptional regulator [Micromonospora sp. KLBMP9576]|uniref:MarR family winged helix-turn-helix transcriptional regulator n=1 Tax=Micromonospora sp. KLBMP9576 TaxID=3424769 RepID=UPI003D8B9E30